MSTETTHRSWSRTPALLLFSLSLAACGNPDGFTDKEWETIQQLGPMPKPSPDPTNRYADNEAAAALGQKLFFETRYSGALTQELPASEGGLGVTGEKGKVACASCHVPGDDFHDTRTKPGNVSLGTGFTTRNAPSLVNVALYDWYGWGGKQDSLWTQASLSPESADNTGGNRCGYAHMLYSFYRAEYNAIFDEDLPEALNVDAADAARFPASCKPKASGAADGPWELMADADREIVNRIMANQGKSVAAYERKLISENSPFDRYVAGEGSAMSPSAKRGLKLFIGKGFCIQCHSGALFSDQKFHNVGLPQEGPRIPADDHGRFNNLASAKKHAFSSAGKYSDDPTAGAQKYEGLTLSDEADRGRFRTKSLRNVSRSAPFFHTGAKLTLSEVIDFYNEGGGTSGFSGIKDEKLKPLNLSSSEKADLVAFLETLEGEPVPEALTRKP